MALTTWLPGRKIVDLPPHSKFCSAPIDALITTKPDGRCTGCAQAATAGHETLDTFEAKVPAPDSVHLHLRTLREIQWRLFRLAFDTGRPIGSEPGFLINATASYNYSDSNTWEIIAASGCELTLRAPEGTDPRRLTMFQSRTVEPEIGASYVTGGGGFGVVQPGDRGEYVHPSACFATSMPLVLRVLDCDAAARTIRVEFDQAVGAALESCDPDNPAPDAFYFRTWREAGDPMKWQIAPHVNPDADGRRCVHCRLDRSRSVGNYDQDVGVTINERGEHWVCQRRAWVEFEQTDTNADGIVDTDVATWHSPSGVADFPANGYCDLADCDEYEAAVDAADENARPWNTATHGGRFFQQVWGAVDTALEQLQPGYSSHWNYRLRRVEAAGLLSLVGGYSLSTPAGMHAQVSFMRWGAYCAATEVEGADGTRLLGHPGGAWDAATDLATVEHLDTGTHPPAGRFPVKVASFGVQHDPTAYTSNVGATLDPLSDHRRHPERLGIRWALDAGTMCGRPFARWSHAEVADSKLIAPRVDLTATAADQVRAGVRFRRLASPVTIGGVAFGGYLDVLPLRQDSKDEHQVAQRTVAEVTALTGNRYQIDLENAPRRAGFPDGTPGNRFDRVVEWQAGGVRPFFPPAFADVKNYYDGGSMGSPLGGVFTGDTVAFDLTQDGQDLNARRFVVLEAHPHGGDAAADWGAEKLIRRLRLGGCFTAAEANTALPDDQHGPIACPTLYAYNAVSSTSDNVGCTVAASIADGVVLEVLRTGELLRVNQSPVYLGGRMTIGIDRGHAGTTAAAILAGDTFRWHLVTDATTGAPFDRRLEIQRPTIAAGECWCDFEANRVYFNATDEGTDVDLHYSVEGQDIAEAGCYAEAYTVEAWAPCTTDLAFATYAGTTPRALELLPDGTAQSYIAGDPGAGEWTIYDDAGDLAVRLPLALAGRLVDFEITTGATLTAPPAEVAPCSDYLAYGKRRDRMIVLDESGLLAGAGASVETVTASFYWSAARFMPPSVVEVVAYGANDWQALDAADFKSDHGLGCIWFTEAKLDALETALGAEVCFRV